MNKNKMFQILISCLTIIVALWALSFIPKDSDSVKIRGIEDYLKNHEAKEKLDGEVVRKVESIGSSLGADVFQITTDEHDYMIFKSIQSDKTYKWKWYELKEK